METEAILATPARVLSQAQREFYFEQGYLLLERIVPEAWIERLLGVTREFIERGRGMTRGDDVFDFEPDHSAANPRLRRLTSPEAQHPVYWEFAAQSIIADVAADLVGPDVRFHQGKLNFKWASGGAEVKLHQDISFWPHTNYSPLTIGTYLGDVGEDQGPLSVLPGSHKGKLYEEYDAHGKWLGCLRDEDIAAIDASKLRYLSGPAGSITVHNCRTVHGSKANFSNLGRPLLLNVYSSADALPYTPQALPSPYFNAIVRGKPARWAHHDPRPCLLPPDWSAGYTSIFQIQQQETENAVS